MKSKSDRPQNSLKVLLSIYSGEDKEYVRTSSRKARIMFAFIGIFVLLIFSGCFFSANSFFFSLFEGNRWISIPIGFTWGLLVVNMYLLLLYTVSPAILPHKKNQNGTANRFLTLSMGLRAGFMSLLAMIIAQPLNVELFSESISNSLMQHIQEEKARMIASSNEFLVREELEALQDFHNHIRTKMLPNDEKRLLQQLSFIDQKVKTDAFFVRKTQSLLKQLDAGKSVFLLSKKEKAAQKNLIGHLEDLVNKEIESDRRFLEVLKMTHPDLANVNGDFNVYATRLSTAMKKKREGYDQLDYLLSHTNFYVKRIQLILFEHRLSWLTTFLICAIFLFPIYLKYRVRNVTDFYAQRIIWEKEKVEKDYALFKKKYCSILRENIRNYNFASLQRLHIELEKLKRIDLKRYRKYHRQVQDEYRDEVLSKYEYWADHPFRTIPKSNPKPVMLPPVAMMDFLYDDTQTNGV